MRTRTTLAGISLAAAAALGPLAVAGPAVAADPPPPAPPTAPAAPSASDAKILETVCASVQKIIEQIGTAGLVKADALNPAAIHDQCMKSGKVSTDPVKEPAKQPGALPNQGKAAEGAMVPGSGSVHLGGMDLGGVRLGELTLGDTGPVKG